MQTLQTNFDDELEQMEFTNINAADQKRIMNMFWAFVKDDGGGLITPQ